MTTPSARVLARRAAREAQRRREVVTVLAVGQATIVYVTRVLANGATPQEARVAALEAAGELEATAEALRRAVRLAPAERRQLARQLAELGWPTGRIARQLGVSDRAVRYYLAGRACP
jgi:DNA-directed RNA polymerase specialized sigma24 family protein